MIHKTISSLSFFAASCSLGAAWSSIELTMQHLKDRVAFGKPLAEQQVRLVLHVMNDKNFAEL